MFCFVLTRSLKREHTVLKQRMDTSMRSHCAQHKLVTPLFFLCKYLVLIKGDHRIRVKSNKHQVTNTKFVSNLDRCTTSYRFVLFPGVPGCPLGFPGSPGGVPGSPRGPFSEGVHRVILSIQSVLPSEGNKRKSEKV